MSQVVREALAIAIQIGQPVMLWGGPGEGKSRMIEQLAEQLNRPCEVVVGSVREASDFVGLPVRVGNSVSFAPPLWATRCIEHPNTVVFLDELTTAAPSVQAAMLRVILEREVGDLRLPPTVSFVAAANPPEISAGGDDLAPPLANRFCHLDWQADTAHWVSGMIRGWQPEAVPEVPSSYTIELAHWKAMLAGFITARPSILREVPTDTVSQGRAWPSPRTWDQAHRVAAAADAAGAAFAVRSALVTGLVGVGAAIEFLRFANTAELADPEELLAEPSSLATESRVDILLASLAAVTAAVSVNCTLERWQSAWQVLAVACEAGRADVAAVASVGLIEMRQPDWPAPAAAAAFAPVLRAAELV